jgi:hypothetical protein
MRKLLVSVALVTAALASVPAAAQSHGDRGRPVWNQQGPGRAAVNDLIGDLNRAEGQIDRAARQRRDGISPREAAGLHREASQIRLRLNFALRGGVSNREFGDLRARVNRLEQRVRIERNDRDNRRY